MKIGGGGGSLLLESVQKEDTNQAGRMTKGDLSEEMNPVTKLKLEKSWRRKREHDTTRTGRD